MIYLSLFGEKVRNPCLQPSGEQCRDWCKMHASALASSRLMRPEKMRTKARSTRRTVPSQAPAPSEHPDDVCSLEYFEIVHDIRAAKELRKIARVCKTFAHHARFDEDNNIPTLAPGGIKLLTLLLSEDSSDDDD